MSGVEVALNMGPLLRRLGQEVDMHLVGAELGAFMAEMGKVERNRAVLGLAEQQRRAGAVVVAADQDVIRARQRGAADQGINTMQIAPARCAAPIMKGLVEAGFGANKRRLVRGAPTGRALSLLLGAST